MEVQATVEALAQAYTDATQLASHLLSAYEIDSVPLLILREGTDMGEHVTSEEHVLLVRDPLRKQYEVYLVELQRHDEDAERRWALLSVDQLLDFATDIEPSDLSWAQLAEGQW